LEIRVTALQRVARYVVDSESVVIGIPIEDVRIGIFFCGLILRITTHSQRKNAHDEPVRMFAPTMNKLVVVVEENLLMHRRSTVKVDE
jgi:hypothetical protein